MVQLSHPYMTTGKTRALTIWTFVSKVMSLLFNMLSRFVTAFLPRSKHLLISWLQSTSAVILGPPKIKSHCFHYFLIYFPWNNGTRCHDLSFWMMSFKPNFSLSSFIFIKRLFSSLSAIRVVSSAYLKLLLNWLGFTKSNTYYTQKYGEYMNKTTYLKPPRFLVQIWYRFNNFKIWFSFEELILIKFEIPSF